MLLSGAGLFVLGLVIRRYKLSVLIAGYNTASKAEKERYDEEKLVRTVGGFLMYAAILLVFGGLVSMLLVPYASYIATASWIVFSVALLIWLVYINTGGLSSETIHTHINA